VLRPLGVWSIRCWVTLGEVSLGIQSLCVQSLGVQSLGVRYVYRLDTVAIAELCWSVIWIFETAHACFTNKQWSSTAVVVTACRHEEVHILLKVTCIWVCKIPYLFYKRLHRFSYILQYKSISKLVSDWIYVHMTSIILVEYFREKIRQRESVIKCESEPTCCMPWWPWCRKFHAEILIPCPG